jgi:hypothetical protein
MAASTSGPEDVLLLLLRGSGAMTLAGRACGAATRAARAMAALRDALPYGQRLQLLAAATLASVALLAGVARRAPPGRARGAAAAAVCCCNVLLPLLFENERELMSRVSVSFAWTWLASFKARRGGGGARNGGRGAHVGGGGAAALVTWQRPAWAAAATPPRTPDPPQPAPPPLLPHFPSGHRPRAQPRPPGDGALVPPPAAAALHNPHLPTGGGEQGRVGAPRRQRRQRAAAAGTLFGADGCAAGAGLGGCGASHRQAGAGARAWAPQRGGCGSHPPCTPALTCTNPLRPPALFVFVAVLVVQTHLPDLVRYYGEFEARGRGQYPCAGRRRVAGIGERTPRRRPWSRVLREGPPLESHAPAWPLPCPPSSNAPQPQSTVSAGAQQAGGRPCTAASAQADP